MRLDQYLDMEIRLDRDLYQEDDGQLLSGHDQCEECGWERRNCIC